MKTHKNLLFCLAAAVAAAVLQTGCGRDGDLPAPPPAHETEAARPTPPPSEPPLTPPRRVESPPVETSSLPLPPARSEDAVPPPPIRVAALLEGPSGGRAGLVDLRSGRAGMVDVGETFVGYELIAVDPQAETVRLRKDGTEHVLKLAAAKVASGGTGPTRVSAAQAERAGSATAPLLQPPAPPPDIDMSKLRPPSFEPTPEETQRGIDPNDPSTWPADYRGPGIERAMRNQDARMDSATVPVLRARPKVQRDASPEEAARGIDPNDPSTWPADYRGPGIEAALRENPELAPAETPSLPTEAAPDAAEQPYRGSGIENALRQQGAASE